MPELQIEDSFAVAPEFSHRVSIGMPVYNGEQFIHEALDSLLSQTYQNFELIISDNASTDGTARICLEYAQKDSRIRYVRQLINKGPTANFQFVLDEAKGDFFMWAAHDDIWDSSFVEAGVDALRVNTATVAAFGRVRYVKRGVGMFLMDAPPYGLGGLLMDRVSRYLRTNVTDNLIYALYRTSFLSSKRMCRKSSCLEKLIIAEAVVAGGVADAEGMLYTNYYSFKTKESLRQLGLPSSSWQYRKTEMVTLWIVLKALPFFTSLKLLPTILQYRVPMIRNILRSFPRDHEGRLRFDPLVRVESMSDQQDAGK